MGHKEYNVLEIVDVLRRYVAGDSIRSMASSKNIDRNTVRKYLRLAEEYGFSVDYPGDLDEMAYRIFVAVHPEDREAGIKKRDETLPPCVRIVVACRRRSEDLGGNPQGGDFGGIGVIVWVVITGTVLRKVWCKR